MNTVQSMLIGLKGLRVHKIRAFLSTLGIVFGVSSVMAVLSVVEGAREEVLKQLRALGANNILVTAQGVDKEILRKSKIVSPGLTAREADILRETCNTIEALAPVKKADVKVNLRDQSVDCEVVGTTSDFIRVSNFEIAEGRFLTPSDEKEVRRVCVIEEAIRRELFPLRDPIGQTICIAYELYTIVGVLRGKEISESKFKIVDIQKLNRRIYIPLSCALQRTPQPALDHQIDEITIKVASSDQLRPTARAINSFLVKSHHFDDARPEDMDFAVKVALDLFKQTQKTQLIFDIVMGASAGISLIVGGIGIMNIMLANVTERRREIGIRRSVGARERDILKQFLCEALGICLFGGVLGLGLGLGLTWGIARFAQWKTLVSVNGLLLSLVVSLADGVIFGTYPAWKAAKMDPIEALRYE
ncbi:MAG: ABC transporter permease [Planctomycetota bacterium]